MMNRIQLMLASIEKNLSVTFNFQNPGKIQKVGK